MPMVLGLARKRGCSIIWGRQSSKNSESSSEGFVATTEDSQSDVDSSTDASLASLSSRKDSLWIESDRLDWDIGVMGRLEVMTTVHSKQKAASIGKSLAADETSD